MEGNNAKINEINYSLGVYPKAIKYIRETNKIMQKELAKVLSISTADLIEYETSRKPMPREVYTKAFEFFKELEEN